MAEYQSPCEIFYQTGDGLILDWFDERLDTSLLYKNWEYGYPSIFERFYFRAAKGQLFVFDLFSGIIKKLTRIAGDEEVEIAKCIPLARDRCLILYQKKREEVHISIISVDLSKDSYEFIGNPYCIPEVYRFSNICISLTSTDIFCITVFENGHARLYQLKVNHSTLNFEVQATFLIPARAFYHRIIDEHCICVEQHCARIKCVAICDKNGLLTRLEGTGIQLDYNAYKVNGTGFGEMINGCWRGDDLFVSCQTRNSSSSYIRTTSLFVFQLNRRKWIEIRLGSLFPDYQRFNLIPTDNGVMMFYFGNNLKHIVCDPPPDSSFILCRIPLTSPEMLFTLCWLKRNKFPLRKTASVYYDQ